MPELEKATKDSIEKYEKQHISLTAEQDGRNNEPSLTNDDIAPRWLESHSFYEELQNEIVKRIPPEPLLNEMREHREMTDRELQLLHNKATNLKMEGSAKAEAVRNAPQPSINRHKTRTLYAILAGMLLVDGVVTAPTFQSAGFNLYESFCLALAFAFMSLCASHYYDKAVAYCKISVQRRAIAVSYVLILLVTFYFTGNIRGLFLASSVDPSVSRPSAYLPVLFTIFSMGTFFVGVMIRRHSMPKPEQLEQLKGYEALVKERDEYEKLLKEIEAEIIAVTEKNREVQEVNRSILKFAANLENYIIIKAKGGLQQWKRINANNRPDRGRPCSFDSTTYPFTFTIFYTLPNDEKQ